MSAALTTALRAIPISSPFVGDEEKRAVLEVLDSGMLAQGPRVARLEAAFAHLVGVPYAVATSSGTAALHLSLLAHGIGPGDEVITSAFTFIASANSVLLAGAKPVFADVDPNTFNLDPASVRAAIGPRTKAIMPVHLYGYACDMDSLRGLARDHGLIVIEDCAQAIGATFRGQHVGSFGTGAFSLYATKNVMCGEGGMITTSDRSVAEKARLLRNHGAVDPYKYAMVGFNYRMSEIGAALGLVQLSRLAEFTRRRCDNAAVLTSSLTTVVTPRVTSGYGHAWHQYTVRVYEPKSRDSMVRRLAEVGIGTGIFYPQAAHQFDFMRAAAGQFVLPVTERLVNEVLSLPVHPRVSPTDLDRIVQEVNCL